MATAPVKFTWNVPVAKRKDRTPDTGDLPNLICAYRPALFGTKDVSHTNTYPNNMSRLKLKVLDTDRFFTDSPNAGEPGCICSRCHQQIKENEVPLRVAITEDDFLTEKDGHQSEIVVAECMNGREFRLCEACTGAAF